MLRLAVPSAASMTDEALTRANLSGQHITINLYDIAVRNDGHVLLHCLTHPVGTEVVAELLSLPTPKLDFSPHMARFDAEARELSVPSGPSDHILRLVDALCSGDKFPCVGIAMGEAVTKLMEERKNLGPMNAGQLFSRAGLAAAEAVTASTEQLPVADIARVTSSSASAASSSVESCNESRVCDLRKATWMHSPTQYEPGASREAPTSTHSHAP